MAARPIDNVVRRWMEIDRMLHRGGFRPSEWTEGWFVDIKTFRRDLAMFRRLGFEMVMPGKRPGPKFRWRYAKGQRPMFAASEEK